MNIKKQLEKLVQKGDEKAWKELFKIRQEIIGALNVLYLNLTSSERAKIDAEIYEVRAWECGEDLVCEAEKHYKQFVK